MGQRIKRTRSGREYYTTPEQYDAYPLMQLIAFRCPSCHADSVRDRGRDDDGSETWWDLDVTDYGDEGSHA